MFSKIGLAFPTTRSQNVHGSGVPPNLVPKRSLLGRIRCYKVITKIVIARIGYRKRSNIIPNSWKFGFMFGKPKRASVLEYTTIAKMRMLYLSSRKTLVGFCVESNMVV